MSSVKRPVWGVMALVATAAILATSCLSVRLSSMKDDQLVKAGVDAWNAKKAEDARPYWEALRDPETKSKYLGYFDKLDELESLQGAAAAVRPGDSSKRESAYDAFVAKYKAFPAELKLPADMKDGMRPVAVGIATAKVRAGKMEGAKSFIKDAVSLFGDSPEYAVLQKEMDAYARVQAQEREADKSYSSARDSEDFNAKIDAYEAAIADYRKVESASASEMKKLGVGSDSILAAQSAALKKKRGAVRIEMERLVRDRGNTFKERIGEEFARVPEGNKLGNMGSEDILKFNEEIRANIESQYKDIIAFSDRYPSVIDKDMIKDIDLQKASLDARISQIEAEVRHAKDIASRGKAAMPLLIGLFNPVPGTKAEGEKSRPAVIRGKMAGEADYWWGMVSIEAGKMNDLVVTMKDGKVVEVYAENTLSGTQIKKKKLPDLVSKGSRIGNSWPVLNAGAVLKNGQYYIKISSNGNPSYSGEVVVYSSFISRVR